MNISTDSVIPDPTKAEPDNTSQRIDARLPRCLARSIFAPSQRFGRSTIVPQTKTVSSLRAKPSTTTTGLPGLNGRAVRQLRELGTVRTVHRALMAFSTLIALTIAASVTVPAYAQAVTAPPPPLSQTFAASEGATPDPVLRDGYTVSAPPPIQWPTALHTKVSDGFGYRVPPCEGCSSFHAGVDLNAGWGAEVHAMAAGIVVEANNPMYSSLGNHLIIQHLIEGEVITTVYGHMQYGFTTLNVGDTVKAGQVIGLVGSTGASTGPHLHFEIRVDNSPVNPLDWLSARIQ